MNIDTKKCLLLRDDIIVNINDSNLNRFEAVYTLAQVFIDIGTAIQGYDHVPTVDQLKTTYYANNDPISFGDTMILNGLQTQIALADLSQDQDKEKK